MVPAITDDQLPDDRLGGHGGFFGLADQCHHLLDAAHVRTRYRFFRAIRAVHAGQADGRVDC